MTEPMLRALLFGAIAGVVLRFVPEDTRSVILNDMAMPLMLTIIQLSLASPETVTGVTVLLESLKMPADMVGMFSAFNMFTKNASAAFDVTYSMLEELDAARETDMIKEQEQAPS